MFAKLKLVFCWFLFLTISPSSMIIGKFTLLFAIESTSNQMFSISNFLSNKGNTYCATKKEKHSQKE